MHRTKYVGSVFLSPSSLGLISFRLTHSLISVHTWPSPVCLSATSKIRPSELSLKEPYPIIMFTRVKVDNEKKKRNSALGVAARPALVVKGQHPCRVPGGSQGSAPL